MNSKLRKVFHAAVSAVLTITLAIPVVSAGSMAVLADDGAVLISTYDFEKGLREFYDEDEGFQIVASDPIYIRKEEAEMEGGDTVDANGFMYMGTGSTAKYYSTPVSNQPSTAYEDERGTVFNLCKTYDLPELVKTLPAGVEKVEEKDEEGNVINITYPLDQSIPVGTKVREAATYKSAVTFTNPFAKLEDAGAVLAFWGKASTDADDKTAFLEFENGADVINFGFNAESEAAGNAGEWYFYTYVITADGIQAYVNGAAAADDTVIIDGNAPEDYIGFLKEAAIYLGATNNSSLRTHEYTRLDNIGFYNGTMTADEVAAIYQAELDALKETADIGEPLAFYAMDSLDFFTDVNSANPAAIERFNINGHEVMGTAVAENVKTSTKAGIKLNVNPFAGKRLKGLSISYWIKNNPKEKKADKGILDNTATITFMDKAKDIYNLKESKSDKGFSIFKMYTNMIFRFDEGGYAQIAGSLNNQYYSDSGAQGSEEAQQFINKSGEWHYITLNINNNGVSVFYDGEKLERTRGQGTRFLDGFYRRESGVDDIKTIYGVLSGSRNQMASMMLDVLTYEDMSIYFGYLPTTDDLSETTAPINVARITCFDKELTDEQAKQLYDQEVAYINTLDEYVPDGTAGDLDGDGVVDANDALIALKAAAQLIDMEDAYLTYGDMDGNGVLDANDALIMLKIAAQLPIE